MGHLQGVCPMPCAFPGLSCPVETVAISVAVAVAFWLYLGSTGDQLPAHEPIAKRGVPRRSRVTGEAQSKEDRGSLPPRRQYVGRTCEAA